MRKLLVVLLMLLCMTGMALTEEAEVFTEGDFTYVLTDEGAVIADYLCPAPIPEVIEVPAVIGGNPVVGFDFVFSGNLAGDVRQVILSEGITTVGDAFVECHDIDEIVLPASLADIPEDSFHWEHAEIVLHPDNPHFTNEDGFLIDTRTNTLLYTAPSAADKPLPEVSRLGDNGLENWHAGEHVDLPDTLTSIGAGVFYDCVDVTGVTIPAGVTEIGAGAFNCTSLTSIDLPDGLTSIPDLMLSCNDITEIAIPESVKYIGSWAFYLCPLTRVEIPATCTFVAWDAFDPEVELVFHGYGQLETYFEYVERTGDDSLLEEYTLDLFEYELTDEGAVITNWNYNGYGDGVPRFITLPSELGEQPVIGIANNALNTYEMDSEHSFTLVIPEGVKWLSDDAFWCCHNADAIYFPASLTNIPEGCFDHVHAEFIVAEGNPRYEMRDGFLIDKQRDAIVYTTPQCADKPIPAVRRIGSSSMENWGTEWEQDVVIPEGVEEIGSFAFYDWILGHVTLPESLRVIETEAFCVVITEPVVIPASVELVQRGAFFYDETSVIVTSDSTHFETSEEYEARVGYLWWGDDE